MMTLAFSVLRYVRVSILLGLSCLATAGCGSLPADVERPVSQALPNGAATPLSELVQTRRQGARPGMSAFALIDSADRAYSSRLALTELAEKTLDIQYYAIHADASTAELLKAVRDAAARGVRVRILLDDFHSTGENAQVMRMAFVPGVEMRMFNPIPGSRGLGILRAVGSLTDFKRMQHRMHNKLYIADNAWGITGGRNLGDAYFGNSEDSNFIDLDILAGGPVVRQMSASFDHYWNNPLAYPVESLISPDELKRLREGENAPAAGDTAQGMAHGTSEGVTVSGRRTGVEETGAAETTEAPPPLPPAMDLQKEPLIWAPATLIVDEPAKLSPEENDEYTQDTVVDGLLSWMQQARSEVLIVSPYFVPGEKMMEVFRGMRDQGVRIRLLTNSLAANDAPLAHVGYARYREDLLAMGVEVHEMRALQRQGARTMFGSSGGGSKASLHVKLVVVDGRLISIGSMNLDLRSKLQNSEVALLIRSRALSQKALELIQATLDRGAWQLKQEKNGDLAWIAPAEADFDDAQSEPDAGLGLRFILWLLGPLAPEEML